MLRLLTTALIMVLMTLSAFAVNPDEVLTDAALEARARNISSNVRCMVCQNQSVDDSDADLAKDLRVLIRERLTQGDSDQEVFDFLVSRYGKYVLLHPPLSASTIIAWTAPITLLLVGFFVLLRSNRSRHEVASTALSQAEHDQLKKILDDREAKS